MYHKKLLLLFLFLLSGFSFTSWQVITYDAEDTVLFTWTLSGISNNQSTVRYTYGGNNFGWLFFLRDAEILSSPETIYLTWTNKSCYKKIQWVYYNNQRGMRFRPLDQDTLTKLQATTWAYVWLSMTWWLFMWCNGAWDTRVYGNITHMIGNTTYELIAGVEMNFSWNSYLNFWLITHLPIFWSSLRFVPATNWLFLSGHVFDSYGWIGKIWWSGVCVDSRSPDPNTVCSNSILTQYSNCWNITYTTGTKYCWWGGAGTSLAQDNCCTKGNLPWWNTDCDDNSLSYYDHTCVSPAVHAAPGVFCKYDDEKYLDNGIFPDTKYHRWFTYVEIMRKSCLHRGQWMKEWVRRYGPNEYITKAATLKTLVKIRGIVFDDFSIETEDKPYPGVILFADVNKNHWFSRYTQYAYSNKLADGLYTTKGTTRYFTPDVPISRNDIIKKIMITYHEIYPGTVSLSGTKSKLVDVTSSDPYYKYIREAEVLWFISWSPQKDGTYRFDGKRWVLRAEFAKMISIPFNAILFDE